MATKRSRVSNSSSSSRIVAGKFVSEEAKFRFERSKINRTLCPERGFTLHNLDIVNMFEARNWRSFCTQPKAGVVSVVREFYANAGEKAGEGIERKVFVRGKWVMYGENAINTMFGLEDIDTSAYDALCSEPDCHVILQELCHPGAVWKDPVKFILFQTKYLKVVPALWYAFLVSRLMPVSHVSEVTKDRAMLLFAIVTGIPLNVGRIISSQILQCAHSPHTKLLFPSIITELCVLAGVEIGVNDELIQAQAPIDEKISAGKTDNRSQFSAIGSSNAAPPHQPQRRPRTAKVDDLLSWAAHQEQYQRVNAEYMTSVDMLMRGIADHLGMDSSLYPRPPPYPPTFDFHYPMEPPPVADDRMVPPQHEEDIDES